MNLRITISYENLIKMKIPKEVIRIFMNLKKNDLGENRNLKSIVCFKCKKAGHIAENCFSKKYSNMTKKIKECKGIDLEEIELNGVKTGALFDTGSSLNLITDKALCY
ncbi:hypothetical protein DMUE_1048 [Dictyocoela muelleri]|nr:hypothetical protein DMUE_1048 [Dictyocoela muelleri]